MTDTQDASTQKMSVEEWLAIRKEAAAQIDPDTAEVFWKHGEVADPYGVDPDLPDECMCIGRIYFARNPETDVSVAFEDLTDEVRNRLWENNKAGRTVFHDLLDYHFDDDE